MKSNQTQSVRKYGLVLLAAVVIAIIVMILTKGKLDLFILSRTRSEPTDKEENMVYSEAFRASSAHVLERNGIVLRADGTELIAYALTEDVVLNAGSIAERSSLPIQRISEYVGSFYMYDGAAVYRLQVGDTKLKAAVEDCLKFEPMGNYIYSLKDVKGERRLHRCNLNGSDEKILFKESVTDFWAENGDLLMKLTDGTYRWYNVLSQNSFNHRLPEDATQISLYGGYIYYLQPDAANNGMMTLYRVPCAAGAVEKLTEAPVVSYCAGEGNCAILFSDGEENGCSVTWFDITSFDGNEDETTDFKTRTFAAESAVDISAESLFVTEPDGTTWYSSLDGENWRKIFED